ncbi:MAG: 23S rRNA (uracil(1939)-C(5))-methyltransferase RlmD [Lachnospiraceae bacterium]|nr:23S rRNA (uracil(1939)-C(5))-methyltransferase RlmD [Lachnospiraceae bacterium]
MKKGGQYTGKVEKLNFPNKGIVSLEEEKVLIKNVIPNQTISFIVQKKRKGKAQGRLVEVLEKSPVEIDSPCPHFGTCGGCTYQNLPYEEQLKIKESQVKELLDSVYRKREEQPVYQFEGIKASPVQFAYRNKMEFSFGDERKDGPLSLGMHKRGSFYDVVSVEQCQIVDEDYRLILKTVLDYFQDKQISFYHRMKHTGCLRHLLVRKAVKTGEILIVLVTTTQEAEALAGLLEGFVEALLDSRLKGKIAGILHTKNDSLADVVKSDETIILYGKDYFYEELLGLKFKISQFSFFQTNSLGAEVLYETAREYIGKLDEDDLWEQKQYGEKGKRDKVVFDLYSGTGTIAQMLAPVAKKVIGVEIVEEAVEAARINAQQNELSNCEFIAGDVLKVLDDIEDKPDLIVLDPPRDGIHPKALQKIIAYGVERIVYISCKPTSLVRDLEVFLESGYEMVRASGVDMFPGTGHVESIVLLSHKSPDSHINVKVEFGEGEGKVPLDAIAERAKKYQPKPKITYKMIQEYVEKKYGFKVHTAYIAEVKRSLGLTMYDAPNAVEELKQLRKHSPKEKVEAIKDALKYFEVI